MAALPTTTRTAPPTPTPAAAAVGAIKSVIRKAAAVARQKKFANKSVTVTLDGLTARLGHKVLEKIARSGELAGGKKVSAKAKGQWRDKAELVAELRSLWPENVAAVTVTPPEPKK